MNRRQRLRSWARPYWQGLKTWLVNYGFAALVLLGFVGGVVIAWLVDPPQTKELPGLAFRSELLYRNEIGGISFLFYYLAILLFVLALNGRGLTKFGWKEFSDGPVVNREAQGTFEGQEQSIKALERDLAGNIEVARQLSLKAQDQDAEIAQLRQEVAELRGRLDDLEK